MASSSTVHYYYHALLGMVRWDPLERELLSSNGDSPLIKKHATRNSFDGITLRTFYLPHHKKHKLPQLPLVVFIHGLGGQLNQFEYLLDYFSHFASVVSLDLPGHGQSEYVQDWNVYAQPNLLALIQKVIDHYCEEPEQEVVLIGHSMGSVLSVKLAAESYLGKRCKGVVAICPPGLVDEKLKSSQRKLGYVPIMLFDLFRSFDRQGGLDSKSIQRMVVSTDPVIRKKQLRSNLQVNSGAWLRTAYNFIPAVDTDWRAISCPLYIIGAEKDQATPPDIHVAKILSHFSSPAASECAMVESIVIPDAGHSLMIEKPQLVCGLIGDFVTRKIDQKLSLAWQLGFLASKKDKWSLKNESKWKSVKSVGDRVEGSPFRAIKTLRQDDEHHSPSILESSHKDICHIIDISRETPPYEPLTFKRIKYHKFPTVSKIPPTESEVNQFIQLVDECLAQSKDIDQPVIAVHCHYGFNRTGFFIVSYMIQKLDIPIKDALDRFAQARPPGIKHIHFRDELYVRYDL